MRLLAAASLVLLPLVADGFAASFQHDTPEAVVVVPSRRPGRLPPSSLTTRRWTTSSSDVDENDESSVTTDCYTSSSSNNNNSNTKLALFQAFGKGITRDFSNRLPDYMKSDIKDGLNAQSLATILYLFFACLAPAIGFGGILHVATAGSMGVLEMMLSTSVCGMLYAAFAPQPMQLIGPMGPTLAFTISLVGLAQHSWQVPFLPLYAWTGLWTAGFLGLAACTSASHVVQHLTRFTDEIFSVLISTIFLVGAVADISKTFQMTTGASSLAVALLTLTCAAVTLGSSLVLKNLPNTRYLTQPIRKQLSNFAPAIGVVLGSVVAAKFKHTNAAIALPALALPAAHFGTTTGRPWLIPLRALPVWARWASSLPALLAAVLLFLDQNITARLVNRHPGMIKGKRRQQKDEEDDDGANKKNDPLLEGLHGDLLVVSALTALTSLVGLPWMAGATTRSAAHVRSLETSDGKLLENRVSGWMIHALIGACAVFGKPRQWLAQVPLPVLSGVFLYLGLTSLQGLELWDRFRQVFQDVPPACQGSHLWTATQVACVAALYQITQSSWGVAAPLLIAVLPLLRKALISTKLVSKEDVKVLDS